MVEVSEEAQKHIDSRRDTYKQKKQEAKENAKARKDQSRASRPR
jgi:hypothetical protein